jgi:hypothetical protein
MKRSSLLDEDYWMESITRTMDQASTSNSGRSRRILKKHIPRTMTLMMLRMEAGMICTC